MLKKLQILIVIFGTIALGLTITNAPAALYQMVVRLTTASNFVANFTASATAASYQHTCQVVDQTGTVMNPGTASATSASADCIIRVVDANGFVQSALGSAATPVPTPVFITVNSGTNIATPQTLAGSASGDVAIWGSASTVQFPAAPGAAPYFEWLTNGNQYTTGNFLNIYARPITPQDTTTLAIPPGLNTNEGALFADYRNVIAHTDGLPAVATGTSTSPAGTAVTTTLPNDLIVWIAAFGASANLSACPTGFSLRVSVPAVSGVTLGIAICDKVQAVAGAVGTAAGTLSASTTWGVQQFAVQQIP